MCPRTMYKWRAGRAISSRRDSLPRDLFHRRLMKRINRCSTCPPELCYFINKLLWFEFIMDSWSNLLFFNSALLYAALDADNSCNSSSRHVYLFMKIFRYRVRNQSSRQNKSNGFLCEEGFKRRCSSSISSGDSETTFWPSWYKKKNKNKMIW